MTWTQENSIKKSKVMKRKEENLKKIAKPIFIKGSFLHDNRCMMYRFRVLKKLSSNSQREGKQNHSILILRLFSFKSSA